MKPMASETRLEVSGVGELPTELKPSVSEPRLEPSGVEGPTKQQPQQELQKFILEVKPEKPEEPQQELQKFILDAKPESEAKQQPQSATQQPAARDSKFSQLYHELKTGPQMIEMSEPLRVEEPKDDSNPSEVLTSPVMAIEQKPQQEQPATQQPAARDSKFSQLYHELKQERLGSYGPLDSDGHVTRTPSGGASLYKSND